jgi:hypothetical protein
LLFVVQITIKYEVYYVASLQYSITVACILAIIFTIALIIMNVWQLFLLGKR